MYSMYAVIELYLLCRAHVRAVYTALLRGGRVYLADCTADIDWGRDDPENYANPVQSTQQPSGDFQFPSHCAAVHYTRSL